MKAYGLHGHNSSGDQDWAIKGRAREAMKREVKSELQELHELIYFDDDFQDEYRLKHWCGCDFDGRIEWAINKGILI